ncbi:hypothetical protein IODZLFCR_CDS0018 [Salmonella phage vB_SalP_SE29]|uniref:Uncharacterized protein n=1 Tax=Salmonella phage vB_SalP_SE29 TaxID=3134913 RepID=A0AAX4LXH1_9CAUD
MPLNIYKCINIVIPLLCYLFRFSVKSYGLSSTVVPEEEATVLCYIYLM